MTSDRAPEILGSSGPVHHTRCITGDGGARRSAGYRAVRHAAGFLGTPSQPWVCRPAPRSDTANWRPDERCWWICVPDGRSWACAQQALHSRWNFTALEELCSELVVFICEL